MAHTRSFALDFDQVIDLPQFTRKSDLSPTQDQNQNQNQNQNQSQEQMQGEASPLKYISPQPNGLSQFLDDLHKESNEVLWDRQPGTYLQINLEPIDQRDYDEVDEIHHYISTRDHIKFLITQSKQSRQTSITCIDPSTKFIARTNDAIFYSNLNYDTLSIDQLLDDSKVIYIKYWEIVTATTSAPRGFYK
jgi:hypothetical protein